MRLQRPNSTAVKKSRNNFMFVCPRCGKQKMGINEEINAEHGGIWSCLVCKVGGNRFELAAFILGLEYARDKDPVHFWIKNMMRTITEKYSIPNSTAQKIFTRKTEICYSDRQDTNSRTRVNDPAFPGQSIIVRKLQFCRTFTLPAITSKKSDSANQSNNGRPKLTSFTQIQFGRH